MAVTEGIRRVLRETLQLGDRVEGFDDSTALFGSIPEFDSMAVVTVPQAAAGPDCGPQLPIRMVSCATATDATARMAAMRVLMTLFINVSFPAATACRD